MTDRIKVKGKWVEPIEFDPNPLYCPDLPYAFDPKYGPETQEQIDWHLEHKTPGAELWEVGLPAAPYA